MFVSTHAQCAFYVFHWKGQIGIIQRSIASKPYVTKGLTSETQKLSSSTGRYILNVRYHPVIIIAKIPLNQVDEHFRSEFASLIPIHRRLVFKSLDVFFTVIASSSHIILPLQYCFSCKTLRRVCSCERSTSPSGVSREQYSHARTIYRDRH